MIWSCSCSCTLTYCNMETGPRYVIEDHFELPEKKGHNLTSLGGGSIYQFIVQENGHVLAAVSDPRERVAFQLVINQNYVLTWTLYMINWTASSNLDCSSHYSSGDDILAECKINLEWKEICFCSTALSYLIVYYKDFVQRTSYSKSKKEAQLVLCILYDYCDQSVPNAYGLRSRST